MDSDLHTIWTYIFECRYFYLYWSFCFAQLNLRLLDWFYLHYLNFQIETRSKIGALNWAFYEICTLVYNVTKGPFLHSWSQWICKECRIWSQIYSPITICNLLTHCSLDTLYSNRIWGICECAILVIRLCSYEGLT